MRINWYDLSKYRNQLYGISMLWIVVFHVWETFRDKISFNWTISFIISNGRIGVDAFLFLSGISMYFAIQKYIDRNGNILLVEFYRKRVAKILKVYLLFCVPYFIFRYIILSFDLSMFLQQVFFCKQDVSSFWFLLCISICYFIYPFIYKAMVCNRKRYIYMVLLTYIIGLFCLATLQYNLYDRFEILLSRIPVFILGSICGEKVYRKDEMNAKNILVATILLLSKGPILAFLRVIPFYNTYSIIINRLYGSLLGICTIIFLILIMKYIEELKVFKLLGFLGTFTLETYVFHIAYRYILLYVMKLPVESYVSILLFLIFYSITSFVFGYLLNRILNCKIKKDKCPTE